MGRKKSMFLKKDLQQATDSRSWERGVNYFREDRAAILMLDSGVIHACVAGVYDYEVQLWVEDGEIDGQCSCPMGEDGVFCKHCVATGLTYINEQSQWQAADAQSGKGSTSRKKRMIGDDIRAYLASVEKNQLIELIMQQLPQNEELRQQLNLEMAKAEPGGMDFAAYRQAITDATRLGRDAYIDYHEVPKFTRRIDTLIDRIEKLLHDGYAAEVLSLMEHAINRFDQTIAGVDDSDGYMLGIMERLVEVHYEACLAARPDEEKLAECLFKWEMNNNCGAFYCASRGYADVLGSKGLEKYHQLAKAKWNALAVLNPGQRQYSLDTDRRRLERIMESLAEVAGDVDQHVAVICKDLSSPPRYIKIVEIYEQAGQTEKALQWAERGLKQFSGQPNVTLENYVADAYLQAGRHDDAMRVIWGQFTCHKTLESYKHLKQYADRCKQWSAWREKAITAISKPTGGRRLSTKRIGGQFADRSVLVSIYLWEKKDEMAWQEAQGGGCSDRLWMELADRRKKKHPEDALDIYRKQVDRFVGTTNNQAYREAVALIERIGRLMKKNSQRKEFNQYLSELKLIYKRKRNFITMLDQLEGK